ncbi:uncharacterized protein LOC130053105 [Ostrea edulis]|uniref:uncharacterized protein LOC130049138 n=1 Tax=Ostrea edulis TaxID=37623 RepID=UPI0024AEE235|nr:uncharacterized protein LOC130049138 [Ostrea edulis]XP_056007579.1 uncharacterized protein LOC130050828 [Ostrea edulis]XP_056007589.1 uncharacterized protein LOC130050832 [Ostrea edulis]XP_056008311.1 uncharacterized protein LOC130051056 [Ostrea edulis]XP_056014662.1 uncharacterized protein LOC130052764 [Ostrea edulis]XP_056015616.1 uncharacterized protein LOC130053064 [Ostrea edulis]XP_056015687.1 uncharacterized protein LOC130053105 [Ostrea edulis]
MEFIILVRGFIRIKRILYFRKQSTVVIEKREGENFKCEIVFDETDMTMVPEPTVKQHSSQQHFPLVFFDLESTGLTRDSHITQLSCVVKKNVPPIPFQKYLSQ